jgi:hypothetical protein
MPANLFKQKTASRRLARWWIAAANSANKHEVPGAEFEVREDRLFASDTWLGLGNVSLRLPDFDIETTIDDEGWSREDHFYSAFLEGAYEWAMPDAKHFEMALLKAVGGKANEKNDTPLVGRARDAFAYALGVLSK